MNRLFKALLLFPALLLALLVNYVTFWLAFGFLPAPIVWGALALFAGVGLWFVLSRRGNGVAPGAESSLLGTHTSKGGLL